MITHLQIKNFKSLEKVDLGLGKITVLTGANNSGKSSFIYSILSLKNIITNPNQSIDSFLTLPFINLGGFLQTVFLKNEELKIELGLTVEESDLEVNYTVELGKTGSKLKVWLKKPFPLLVHLEVAFPYPVNKAMEYKAKILNIDIVFHWNGIVANVISTTPALGDRNADQNIKIINTIFPKLFNLPINSIAKIDFVPIRRGFTKPFFSPVPLQAQLSTEDELATLLATDRDLAGKVAHYLEKIVERSFTVYTTPGTANFYLQTRDKKNGFTSDLVNEGLGTNQLVTILSKILQKNNCFICIDEPEIHLHPTIIDNLVSVLIEIAEHEGKQFLISTHSEHFIFSLLKNVSQKTISNKDIKVYYLNKLRKETTIELQEINEHGQIEGGLKNFYIKEISNIKTIFKITD